MIYKSENKRKNSSNEEKIREKASDLRTSIPEAVGRNEKGDKGTGCSYKSEDSSPEGIITSEVDWRN